MNRLKIPCVQSVAGNSILTRLVGLFAMLAFSAADAWGQTVMVVGPNNAPLSAATLNWTCVEGDIAQTVTLDQQGVLWPIPECQKATVIVAAFGFVTDTMLLERPNDEESALRLMLQPLHVGLSSAVVEEQLNGH